MLIVAQLKRTPGPVRASTGWFIPSGDAAAWLDEIARWPVTSDQLRFYIVASLTSTEPAGVLVVPLSEMILPAGSRAQAYGELRRGFFLPVDAELYPPLSTEELVTQGRYPVIFFHPALGLTGFEPSAERRAHELLMAPTAIDENWSRARAIAPPNDRLRAIRLTSTLSLDELFGEESKEIGSEPPADLPPSPDEPPMETPSRIAEGASNALAKFLLALTKIVPRKPGIAPTWVNHLEAWAQKKPSGESGAADLEKLRHQELQRLLRMLETDPVEGLRHAISLAQLASRGRATPSAKLGRRDLDFNLRRLGGGGAGDAWRVPNDMRNHLAKSYREAAQREAKLGHYRRAACIYAELLGDFSAAANILKEGRCFKEAALLYNERLRDPMSAAACFANGGLIHEAIALYEKHEYWLALADLHTRLGADEEAKQALRRAVAFAVGKNDALSAARLLETRLNEPEEALKLLASTWPKGKQAFRGLEEWIALLARLNRHDALQALCVNLGREPLPLANFPALVGILVKVTETATDERVRRSAAHAVQTKVSLGLTEKGLKPTDELILLRAITRLAPHDRLLSRDVKRFRETRPKAFSRPPPIPAKPAPLRKFEIVKGKSMDLPYSDGWLATADAEGFQVVASRAKGQLSFMRGTWKKEFQTTTWNDPAPELKNTVMLAVYRNATVVARPFAEKLTLHHLPDADAFPQTSFEVGTPLWMPTDAIQASAAGSTLWVIRVVGTRVILVSYEGGKEVRSRDITEELTAAGASGAGTSLCLEAGAVPGQIALAFGQHVLVRTDQDALKIQDMGARVIGLLPVKCAVTGWIALLERGAVLISPGLAKTTVIDDTLELPRGAFLSNDRLVLASSTEGRLFRIHPEKNFPLGWFQFEGEPGFAFTATDDPEEFALFHHSGKIQRWRLT